MVRYIYKDGAFSHNQRLYFLYDTLGSVAQVTAENGSVVQEYLYTPYGEAYNTAADSVNGLRFVGRYGGYTDDDTRLTYFWHRWYDSGDGRWVSRDPIGVAGGVNLYGYVNNRALYYIDVDGLIGGVVALPAAVSPPVVVVVAVVTTCGVIMLYSNKEKSVNTYLERFDEHSKNLKDPRDKNRWCNELRRFIQNAQKACDSLSKDGKGKARALQPAITAAKGIYNALCAETTGRMD